MGWLSKDRAAPEQPTRREALDCIPVKNRHAREQRLDNGDVVVLYPVAQIGAPRSFQIPPDFRFRKAFMRLENGFH